MKATAPTFNQIRAQVAAIRKRAGEGHRVFGIQTTGRWSAPPIQQAGGETYHVIQCDSSLAMRAALQDHDPNEVTKVLLTSLSHEMIPGDIRVRLARRKFHPINHWNIVKDLFQVRQVDPRIVRQAWIAERLMEFAPQDGYSPLVGGVLDAETVWGILLEKEIGLSETTPDLVTLLEWSMDEGNVRRYKESPEEFRAEATTWIGQHAGAAARAVLTCVRANERPDALPIGLAMGVVFSDEAKGELDRAAGRIEKYLGHAELNDEIAQRWSSAAAEVVTHRMGDAKIRSFWLRRADEILGQIQADSHAYLSDTSPSGFARRLARYGEALSAALKKNAGEMSELVKQRYEEVLRHEQAATWERDSRRVQRVTMSLRLLRWLLGQPSEAQSVASLAAAASGQTREGGFVDWARYMLKAGDAAGKLGDAYASLSTKALQIIEAKNRRFAELLRDWTAAGSSGNGILRVENVLEKVLAPVAADMPVLLLVMDGMSCGVFRELTEELTRGDWTEIRPKDQQGALPVIAAIPSLTEVSRASLLCGRLTAGQSSDEKAGFAENSFLQAQCRTGAPVLFHKDALQGSDEGSLAGPVIKEIESARRRIVGVVINAIDDHLLKGEQLDIPWTSEGIKVLPAILQAAREAGRAVVLVSDHGHVLDQQTRQRKHDGSDRWRADDGRPAEDEIQISGERVVLPQEHRLIALWSEKTRYSIKKNGYHGGVSMQEMVIPLAVLTAGDNIIDGWDIVPPEKPDWWFASIEAKAEREEPIPVPVKPPRKKPDGFLFDKDGEEPEVKPVVATTSTGALPAWIDGLLVSEVFKEQKQFAGRTPPSDEVIRRMLFALHEQGGKLTSPALANRIQQPAFRLPGLLAAIQRILNVDGYAILTRDEASDTVELNRELLVRQFDLS